jgi:hypothetical protein
MTLLASCRLASQPKQGSEVPAYFKLLNVSFGVTKVLNDRYRKYPWLTTHGRTESHTDDRLNPTHCCLVSHRQVDICRLG